MMQETIDLICRYEPIRTRLSKMHTATRHFLERIRVVWPNKLESWLIWVVSPFSGISKKITVEARVRIGLRSLEHHAMNSLNLHDHFLELLINPFEHTRHWTKEDIIEEEKLLINFRGHRQNVLEITEEAIEKMLVAEGRTDLMRMLGLGIDKIDKKLNKLLVHLENSFQEAKRAVIEKEDN